MGLLLNFYESISMVIVSSIFSGLLGSLVVADPPRSVFVI
jgi:hypothetical protein